MTKSSPRLSLWQGILKILKKFLINFKSFFSTFNPNVLQIVQLTFIYFFAVVDLLYAVLNNVFSLGYLPEMLLPFFPTIKAILQSPIFQIWGSPEKVFFLSYVVIEFMIVRSVFKFSKLVKKTVIESNWVPGAYEFLNLNHNSYNFFLVSATPQREIEDILMA